MFRSLVTGIFLLLSVLVVWGAYLVGSDTTTGDLLLNLGTEIAGIVLTVAIVDWFFERRRLQGRAREMSWNALHAVEHAVWVWQGGPRQLETDELLGLLSAVKPDDPVPDFTQNLLLTLGTRAKQAVKNEPEAVDAAAGLREALEHLARLASIRDGGDLFPAEKIGEILSSGVSHLAVVLGLPDERIPARLIRYRDPSLRSQEQRHFGVTGDSGGHRRSSVEL